MSDIAPAWLTLEGAQAYCGLGERTLQEMVKLNHVISSNVRMPGNSRGRRLIKRESLDAYIEAGIGSISEIAMNKGRKSKSEAAAHWHEATAGTQHNAPRGAS